MKIQSTRLLQKLSTNEIKTLTTQTEERLVTDTGNKKPFTTADMWSIQRQRRIFSVRRFSW
ncbi:hypothetical protein [Ferruginibacter sp. HRS2-29]|uniref:hypothetical protein n=1 Tax=Ferruginibacter sp. HRS2-29 TaxID=2487334 RepID=UPI0020CB9B68|nr:hypothetical protein [Ferruginibacter sp. HRS2-29]